MNVNVVSTDEATTAHVSFVHPITGRTVQAEGAAKKHPRDHPSEEIGTSIALGRAFEAMGRTLHNHGNLKVIEADMRENSGIDFEFHGRPMSGALNVTTNMTREPSGGKAWY